jgi:TolB-like protein
MALLMLMLSAPALASERVRVVVLGFDGSTEALRRLGASVAEQVLTELGRAEQIEAMGASDVQTLLGLERQKSMLGCADSSKTCLTEISAALGAPWLLTGSLASYGKATRLDVKLIRARDGKAVFRDGVSFKEESDLFDLVSGIVKRAVAKMDVPVATPAPQPPVVETVPVTPPVVEPGPVTPTTPVELSSPAPRVAPWVVTAVGGVFLIGGAVTLGLGASQVSDLRARLSQTPGAPVQSPPLSVPDYATARSGLARGLTFEAAGAIAAGVGVLGVAGGLAWGLLGSSNSGRASLTFGVGPGAVAVQGTF